MSESYPPEWFTISTQWFVEKDGLTLTQKSIIYVLNQSDIEMSPAELAEECGCYRDTIYTALSGIDEILDREYGSVSFNDTELSEAIQKSVEKYGDHWLEGTHFDQEEHQ